MAAGSIVDISAGSVDRAVSQSLRKSANEIAPDLTPNSVWEALEFASPVKSVENMARLMASGYLDSGADFYEDRSNFKDQGLADSTMTAAGALVGNELGGGDFSDAYEGKDKYGEKLGTLDRGVRGGRGAVTVVLSAVGTLFGVKQAYKRMMGQADDVVDDLARASDNLDNTAQTTRHAEPVAVAKSELVARIQSKINLYPKIIDPRTGRHIQFPAGIRQRVDKADRVPWTKADRANFIAEWHRRGYETPFGGWDKYDIHHIQPREFGGDNSFLNLVPVERTKDHKLFNNFWREFIEL